MTGMNATTGRDHLYRKITKILTMPIGTRIARRDFGTELLELVDAPNNGATRVRLYAAAATAFMRWEPRLKLSRAHLSTEVTETGAGLQVLDIEGSTAVSGDRVSTGVRLTNGGAA